MKYYSRHLHRRQAVDGKLPPDMGKKGVYSSYTPPCATYSGKYYAGNAAEHFAEATPFKFLQAAPAK